MHRAWPAWLLLLLAAACGPSSPAHVTTPTPPPDAGAAPAPDAAPPAPTSRWKYPAAPRGDTVDTLFGVKVADPYRWLENADDPEVQAWMTAEDGFTRGYLRGLPGRDALADRLKELFYIEAISPPMHEGNRWFVTRKLEDKEKRIVYVRDKKDGPDTVLFDPNEMSADGSVALHGFWPSWDARYVVYKLSKNNSDTATLYVRDLKTGKDTPDVIDGARYAEASWSHDGKGFYYTGLPVDPAINPADMPGKQAIKYHKLGDDPAKDQVLVPAQNDTQLFLGVQATRDGHWLILEAQHGWTHNEVWVKDLRARPAIKPTAGDSPYAQAGFFQMVAGPDALYSVQEYKDRFYIMTNEDAPHYRVFRADAPKLARADWKEIVAERPDAVLQGASVVGGALSLPYLVDVHSVVEIHDLDGKLVRQLALPGVGSSGGLGGREDEDEAYYGYESFVQPTQIFRTSVKTGKSTLWQEIKVPIDTSNMEAEQVFYTSKDGTRVPMFLLHQKDWKKDGQNPVYLTAYGGFDVSLDPGFASVYALWVEHGGVVAIPNLRGGGEYGETWHRAGMLDKKQNVFDDFIGAAEWLIANKVTSPAKLAIDGASNGGLLVGAAMTQRPELYRAVVCGVPLLDMIRFTKFGAGATWAGEYGDPADEKAFKWIYAYSPYHHVVDGTKYPALLMMSADADDRVDPMHARKFVAAVQHATSSDEPVLMRIETHAGHGGGDQVKKWVDSYADEYAFLFSELGMQ